MEFKFREASLFIFDEKYLENMSRRKSYFTNCDIIFGIITVSEKHALNLFKAKGTFLLRGAFEQ